MDEFLVKEREMVNPVAEGHFLGAFQAKDHPFWKDWDFGCFWLIADWVYAAVIFGSRMSPARGRKVFAHCFDLIVISVRVKSAAQVRMASCL